MKNHADEKDTEEHMLNAAHTTSQQRKNKNKTSTTKVKMRIYSRNDYEQIKSIMSEFEIKIHSQHNRCDEIWDNAERRNVFCSLRIYLYILERCFIAILFIIYDYTLLRPNEIDLNVACLCTLLKSTHKLTHSVHMETSTQSETVVYLFCLPPNWWCDGFLLILISCCECKEVHDFHF